MLSFGCRGGGSTKIATTTAGSWRYHCNWQHSIWHCPMHCNCLWKVIFKAWHSRSAQNIKRAFQWMYIYSHRRHCGWLLVYISTKHWQNSSEITWPLTAAGQVSPQISYQGLTVIVFLQEHPCYVVYACFHPEAFPSSIPPFSSTFPKFYIKAKLHLYDISKALWWESQEGRDLLTGILSPLWLYKPGEEGPVLYM